MATPARIYAMVSADSAYNLSGFTSGALVTFNSINIVTGGVTRTAATMLKVPRAGNYIINWHVGISKGATSITPSFDVETVLYVNGASTYIKAAAHQLDSTGGDYSGRQGVSGTCVYSAAADDYFEIWLRTSGAVNGVTGYYNPAGSTPLDGQCRTYFSIMYLDDNIPCLHAIQDAETSYITGSGWGDINALTEIYANNKISLTSNRFVNIYEDGLYVVGSQMHVVNDASGSFDCRLRCRLYLYEISDWLRVSLAGDYRYGVGLNNASIAKTATLHRFDTNDTFALQRNISAAPASGNTVVAGKTRVTPASLTVFKSSRPGVIVNLYDRRSFILDDQSVGSQPTEWSFSSDDTNNLWHVSDKRVRTGTTTFRFGDPSEVFYGHDASVTATLTSFTFYLPSFGQTGYSTYYLRFHVFIAAGTSGAFNLNVQTIDNSSVVSTFDVDASVGYFTGYKFKAFSADIGSSMNGSSLVQIKFTFTSSGAALSQSDLWEGIYIDDLRIEGE